LGANSAPSRLPLALEPQLNAVPDFGFSRVGASIEQQYRAVYEATGDKLAYVRVCLNRAVSAAQVG
jgi:hypothetical protein